MKSQSLQLVCLLVAGLALSCQAQVFSWGRCPDVAVAQNFNTTRYLGKWYEILRFNRTSFEIGTRCNYAVYTREEDGAVGVYNAALRDDGTVDTAQGSGRAPDPNQPAKLKVQFGSSWFAGDYWVLDTDYEQYAMVHSCSGFFFFNFQLNWLLGRSPAPVADVVTDTLEKFRAAGIDTTQFMRTNQTGCPDF